MIKHNKYPYEDQRNPGHQVRTPRRRQVPEAIREAGQGQIKNGIPFEHGLSVQGEEMKIKEFIIMPHTADTMGLIHRPGTGPNNRFDFKNSGNNRANEKAPPGREEQVKALKGKVDNPYAVAWASYNKSKKEDAAGVGIVTKQNATKDVPKGGEYMNVKKLKLDWKEFNENFADGKKKGKSRPGRVKKAGASCKGSVTSLRSKAKKASGERAKMYHWCANMKSGRKKKQ